MIERDCDMPSNLCAKCGLRERVKNDAGMIDKCWTCLIPAFDMPASPENMPGAFTVDLDGPFADFIEGELKLD